MKNALIKAIELNDVVTAAIEEMAGTVEIVDNSQDVTWLSVAGETHGVTLDGDILEGEEGGAYDKTWCDQNHEIVTVLRAAAKEINP